jgi:hypothetical protein
LTHSIRGNRRTLYLALLLPRAARVMPLFPYLDEAEAEGVVKVYEAAKTRVYPEFAAFLEKGGRRTLMWG